MVSCFLRNDANTKQKRRGGTFSPSFFLLFLSFRRRLLLSSDSPSVSLSVLPPLSSASFLRHIHARKKKRRGEQAKSVNKSPSTQSPEIQTHRTQGTEDRNAQQKTCANADEQTYTRIAHIRRRPSRAHVHINMCRQTSTHIQ